jgi:hypothetical protein
MTHYKEDFMNVLQYCNDHRLYLGVGNPDAKILIIGKENTEKSEKFDVDRNLDSWNDIVYHQITDDQLPVDCGKYNSLFPHKGQKVRIERADKHAEGIYNEGTAPTWFYYQKLIDMITNNPPKQKGRDELIDFHQYVFQTELSQVPVKMSHLLHKDRKKERQDSIDKRAKLFCEQKLFFQKFPIVIMACADYPHKYGFDIQKVFNIKYKAEKNKTFGKVNWYNFHESEDGKRVLIHTRQFSNGVNYQLIEAIATACCKYYK